MRGSEDHESRPGRSTAARDWVRAAIAGGGGIILVAAVVQNAGNVAFHVVASHLVGPSRYGALGSLLTLTVALSVPLVALQVVLTRSVAEVGTDGDARLPLRRVTSFAIGLGVVVVLVAPLVQGFLRLESVVQAALLGPYLTLAAIAAAGRGVAIGRGRVGGAAASIMTAIAARLVLGVAGTVVAGIDGALVATVAAEAVGAAVALRAATTRTVEGSSVTLDAAALFETATVTAGVWLLGSIDVLLSRHYLAGPASALYVAAGTATRAVFLLPQAFLMVAMVRFVRSHAVAHQDGGMEAWRALRDTLVVTVVLATTGAIVVATLGPTLLTLAFGSQYSGSGTLFVWLAAATWAGDPWNTLIAATSEHAPIHGRSARREWRAR
jgi:O-antigen/teichoic acid export membrane protein